MKRVIFVFVAALTVYACSSSDDSTGTTNNGKDDFNRGELLANIADNIIIPAYEDLSTKLNNLEDEKNIFIASPSETNLVTLREKWLSAYKVWQSVEMYNIGKAEEINYGFQMNIYPTTVEDIESNVSSGTYDLTHPNNNDAVGFPALDYLLNGLANTDTEIVEKYTNTTSGDGYKNYMSDVVNQMNTLTNTVLNDWKNGFRDTFVASTENTATSSFNKLANDFVYYFEKGLRANKVGIPAGVFSTEPLPTKVEAFYSNENSKDLLVAALENIKNFINGKAYNSTATGVGFADYLDYLNNITQGEDLNVAINNKIDDASAKVLTLDASLSNQVETDNVKMTEAYDALQKVVVLIKVDMLQAFSVSVDYTDADGD
ncbi:imelysin family protein [Cellulophaga omnivescoria]|uniref:imelysin family protein n=1 Tax=Cellulophaga omnivescoria TaxID=1888890 RepID=UPI0022F0FD75|nr:imelysin family protein [Cellulophaga omnivescoria]WBU89530.1 imelysin family protein [Cellulophaga omnivescoria]